MMTIAPLSQANQLIQIIISNLRLKKKNKDYEDENGFIYYNSTQDIGLLETLKKLLHLRRILFCRRL